MNATATTAIDSKTLAGLGIADLQAAVLAGNCTMREAFDVVEHRCQRRIAEKRSLIPAVVVYRNSLANALGINPLPVPVYGKPKPSASASAGSTVDEVVASVVASGVDIATLITTLATKLGK